MRKLKEAVVLTQKYAAYFHGHLTDADLHRWLISDKTYSTEITKRLFPQKPSNRPNFSAAKLSLAKKVVRLLTLVPTVSTIAITGSLAVGNAKVDDDIDLMVITRPDALWLTRLVVIPLLGLFFKRRLPAKIGKFQVGPNQIKDSVCMNLWLDESALPVPPDKRNLYTAHEVLQALPLFDRGGIYRRFIQANTWTKKYLANAYQIALKNEGEDRWSNVILAPTGVPPRNRGRRRGRIKFMLRTVTALLNIAAFKLQYLYMKKRITHETISLHAAYFHPRDLSVKLREHLGIY